MNAALRTTTLTLLALGCGGAPDADPADDVTRPITIDRRDALDAMDRLHSYYASAEGLQRPNGLAIDGHPDFEGLAAWILDVYLNSRLSGLATEVSWRNVQAQIEASSEWQSKHPGQSPSAAVTPYRAIIPVGRSEFLIVMEMLHHYYSAEAGLQRPQGLSVDGRPDFEGVAAWGMDVYLNARVAGARLEDAWARVTAAIRQSDEWLAKSHRTVDRTTLIGKHLAGYQGWFGAPGDGTNGAWGHWFAGAPDAAHATFDLWPDTRELSPDELFATAMTSSQGGPASLFSSFHPRTVARHFRWMAEAGIDGVSLGRFSAGTLTPVIRDSLDRVLDNVRAGAEQHGRVFFVWYDVTGHPPEHFADQLVRDWEHLVRDEQLTASPAYLMHRGLPLLGVWGAGAGDRPGTPAEWTQIIDRLKNHSDPAYRVTLLLGGVADWRTNADWGPVFRQADVVSPWAVAAFGDADGADAYRRDVLEPDLAETQRLGLDYLPILWPGFSWTNLQRGASPLNAVPRAAGAFYWRQAFNVVSAGASTLFTAMFDEVDEGTAILKAAPRADALPVEGTFLALDADGVAVSSDFYLRLAGAAGRMLRGESDRTLEVPVAPY